MLACRLGAVPVHMPTTDRSNFGGIQILVEGCMPLCCNLWKLLCQMAMQLPLSRAFAAHRACGTSRAVTNFTLPLVRRAMLLTLPPDHGVASKCEVVCALATVLGWIRMPLLRQLWTLCSKAVACTDLSASTEGAAIAIDPLADTLLQNGWLLSEVSKDGYCKQLLQNALSFSHSFLTLSLVRIGCIAAGQCMQMTCKQ